MPDLADIGATAPTQTGHELTSATADVNRQTHVYSQYNNEGNTITKLDAQLAAATKPATQASIQKRIAAADALQTRLATQDTTGYNSPTAELTSISTLETNIQSDLDSLPTPAITLSGSFTSVPASLAPGKRATALVTVTNSGNVPASGPLEVALSARPTGTTGSADTTLPTVTVRIRINPSASGNERLSFVVPKTLPAGTYSLVAQLDPNNAFKESALPGPIVSLQTFTVS